MPLGDILEANQFLTAGVGLFGIGSAAAVARRGLILWASYIRRRTLVTLEIPSHDPAYEWVLRWLTSQARGASPIMSSTQALQPHALRQSFRVGPFRLRPPPPEQLALRTDHEQHDDGASTTRFTVVPGVGNHYFVFEGALMRFERTRNTRMLDMQSGTPWESVAVTSLRMHAPLLPVMVERAKEHALRSLAGRTTVYTSYGHEWRPFGAPRRKRPLDSVVLPRDLKPRLVSDLRHFLASAAWYADRGVPYRRGYLLYGPPGSGKSSVVQALSAELEYNICLLSLNDMGMTDDRLQHLMSSLPPRSVLLLEDADAAFGRRNVMHPSLASASAAVSGSLINGPTPAGEIANGSGLISSADPAATPAHRGMQGAHNSNVTLSGLLNALDGVAAAEERIIFMTTNHVESLDPALVRPGRMDLHVHLGWPTEEQVRELFLRFYERQDLVDDFVRAVSSLAQKQKTKLSMAALQGLFIQHKDSAENALKDVRSL